MKKHRNRTRPRPPGSGSGLPMATFRTGLDQSSSESVSSGDSVQTMPNAQPTPQQAPPIVRCWCCQTAVLDRLGVRGQLPAPGLRETCLECAQRIAAWVEAENSIPGPPTKFSAELVEKLLVAKRNGNHSNVAARWAGIDRTTLRRWMLDGEHQDEFPFRQLNLAVDSTDAGVEIDLVALVRSAARHDPELALKFLRQRHPDRWGVSRTEVTGAEGTPLFSKVVVLPPEDDAGDPNGGAG